MKTISKLIVFLALLLLPLAARWYWFYRGEYSPPEIAEVDPDRIVLPVSDYRSHVDEPIISSGRVVFDIAHDNNLHIDDLTPLRDRLVARGMTVQTFDGYEDTLEDQLRGAVALVVIAPTYHYSVDELALIQDFVESGGRLLIAADPTRPVPSGGDEYYDLFEAFFPISAIPAINSLANIFGIVYYDDYLYNTLNNAGNYRNVKFNKFDEHNPLTQGLETLVFFATHSLKSDGIPLVTGDADTFSNVRTGEVDLSAVVLSAGGQVLALGDVSLMTPPYHTVADNDRFLSNLADWLATATRIWDLEDFPYLFTGPVDLVQTFAEALDSESLYYGALLQEQSEETGTQINLRASPDPEHDVIYISTFDRLDDVDKFLEAAGVTIMWVEPEEGETVESETDEDLEETAETDEIEENVIIVDGFGTFLARSSSLFVLDRVSTEHLTLVVLAANAEAIYEAIGRLYDRDFESCTSHQDVTVCSAEDSSKYSADGDEYDAVEEEPAEGDGYEDHIFILSDDDGLEGTSTGVDELEAILSDYYLVTVWSTSLDGIPTYDDLAGYDAYIVTSGDYAYDEDDADTFISVLEIEGNVIFIGDQPLPPSAFLSEPAPLYDLEVVDISHPLSFGFMEGETITLKESASGVPSLVIGQDEWSEDETSTVVFARGSASPEKGTPVVIASEDSEGGRFILANFAFQRLPEDVQWLFALNVAEWLLGY